MAASANVGALVLTHMGPSIGAGIKEGELAAMTGIYQGTIHQADEGWTLRVSPGSAEVLVR